MQLSKGKPGSAAAVSAIRPLTILSFRFSLSGYLLYLTVAYISKLALVFLVDTHHWT